MISSDEERHYNKPRYRHTEKSGSNGIVTKMYDSNIFPPPPKWDLGPYGEYGQSVLMDALQNTNFYQDAGIFLPLI